MKPRLFATWSVIDWSRLSLLAAAAAWAPALAASLWLDELGTFWVISGSFSETVERSLRLQGQSPFTFALMWAWRHLLGTPTDWVLRLLPALAGVASLVVLFAMVRHVVDRETAWIAVAIAAVGLPELTYLTVNLRPYAFGYFFLLLATYSLILWIERPRSLVGIIYMVSAAAAVWSGYYFALAFIAHAIYAIACRNTGVDYPVRRLVGLWTGSVLLMVPLIPQLILLKRRSPDLQYLDTPGLSAALSTFIPLGLTVSLLALAVLYGVPNIRRVVSSPTVTLFAALALVPALSLFVLTVTTELALWTLRYRMASLLGFTVLAALMVGAYTEAHQRKVAVIVVMLVGLTLHGGNPQGQDWRGALRFADAHVSADGLVILSTGFIEAADPGALADPDVTSFVLSPISRYPIQQNVIAAPTTSAELSYPYILDRIDDLDAREVGIVYVAGSASSYEALALYLRDAGFSQSSDSFLGNRIGVLIFERE